MEVYNLHKQLQNEGFKFYNFNSNDIPEYYAVRLNDTHKLISRKLKWRKKKKEIIKVYYIDAYYYKAIFLYNILHC